MLTLALGVVSCGSGDGGTGEIVSTNDRIPASIEVTPRAATVAVGARTDVKAIIRDRSGAVLPGAGVRWSAANATVATVDPDGSVLGVAPGSTVVTAASGTFVDSATVLVTALPASADVTFTITTAQTFPISRFIYGMNFTEDYDGLYTGQSPWYGARPPREVTLDRMGGNRLSAYNWENNFSNAGSDYQFQSDELLSTSRTPGEAVKGRVDAARKRNAATMVTVPMLGYVAADGDGPVDTKDATRATRLATRFKQSVPKKNAPFALNPDRNDGFVYQDEFVNWVINKFPGATTDPEKPIFFSLDNEPDGWHLTHKEIMSDVGDDANALRLQTFDGFISTTIDYARAIKDVAPDALVFGPAVATWAGVVTLGRYPSPDPVHGNTNFLDLYMTRLRAAEAAAGHRLVDVLDIHWYPYVYTQAGEITNDYAVQNEAMIERRLQAPRSLWDPTYNEDSWVSGVTAGPIELLPRLRRDIAARNPGMKIAITEYYYGRTGDISGGIAQADVLGIFGREGVFAANLWPAAGVYAEPWKGDGAKAYAYAFAAFSMFLNYDGNGGRFGDTGVASSTSDPANSSVYGSTDQAGNVVLVLINKRPNARDAAINVSHGTSLTVARPYTLTSASNKPQRQADLPVQGNVVQYTMPPMSVTTLVLTR